MLGLEVRQGLKIYIKTLNLEEDNVSYDQNIEALRTHDSMH